MNKTAARVAERFPLIHQLVTARLKHSLATLAGLFLALAIILYGRLIFESEDLFTKAGPIIGGDFIVFHHAAKAAGTPDMIAIYEMDNLKSQLQAAYPGKGDFAFGWMYPPTMSLLISPFALPPYLMSFTLWVAAFFGGFLVTISRLWSDRWALFFVVSSPAIFQGVITGQNGFLTATLLTLAGAFADRRPIFAGIAAGLLTVKPQLGLLIPIAFIAAGCWRAFITAAVAATLLAGASLLSFGVESWIGFYQGVTAHGARMATEGFPINKLVTPYGLATMLGVPAAAAGVLQLVMSFMLAAYVYFIWRRVKHWDLRLAALCVSAMLATPYAFYYELAIMAPAMLLIARRAVKSGWLPHEKLAMIAIWVLPLIMPGELKVPNISISAVGALLAFFIVARRALPAAGFRFSSEVRPATADC